MRVRVVRELPDLKSPPPSPSASRHSTEQHFNGQGLGQIAGRTAPVREAHVPEILKTVSRWRDLRRARPVRTLGFQLKHESVLVAVLLGNLQPADLPALDEPVRVATLPVLDVALDDLARPLCGNARFPVLSRRTGRAPFLQLPSSTTQPYTEDNIEERAVRPSCKANLLVFETSSPGLRCVRLPRQPWSPSSAGVLSRQQYVLHVPIPANVCPRWNLAVIVVAVRDPASLGHRPSSSAACAHNQTALNLLDAQALGHSHSAQLRIPQSAARNALANSTLRLNAL
ncbi:hypothetical protein EXIGLDRAFT_769472 [Exidia glandulosa HHB12029]|uniref:Uncharacterized protein n=1 Tax=Exidia glandulosa HHB12029 TaxID=1314781 RepID=A0A165HH89_EXIGL|nr:hypothetical protein EXIGLDRAFT_769472 [Exidia glandulosa HHB12029]